MNYRICTKCSKEFEATEEFFYKQKDCKFGLFSICKVCCKKRNQEYYRDNKKRVVATVKEYQENNQEKCAVCVKNWRRTNKEKCNAATRKWCRNNKDKRAAATARRKARKQNQTPYLTEAENQQIRDIYKRREELGSNYHVDHIWPISKGGLHHPNNLQIVTKEYNLQKGDSLFFRLPNDNEIIFRTVGPALTNGVSSNDEYESF